MDYIILLLPGKHADGTSPPPLHTHTHTVPTNMQGQASLWVKNLESRNGLRIIKAGDASMLRILENCLRIGANTATTTCTAVSASREHTSGFHYARHCRCCIHGTHHQPIQAISFIVGFTPHRCYHVMHTCDALIALATQSHHRQPLPRGGHPA